MIRARGPLAVLLLALAVAGCEVFAPAPTPTPTPSPTPAPTPVASAVDPAIALEQIARQVEAIRGLRSEHAIEPSIIDEGRLRSILRDLNAQENPPEVIAAQERLYKALDLLPEDVSLATLSENLLGEQVAGFYVPETDQLYVVSRTGRLGAAEKVTFAHEFDHALQDQAFDLEPLTADAATQGDRALARLALIEGDATLVMTYWAQQHLGFLELLRLFGEAFGPGQASLNAVPSFLRDSLLYPYETGLQFVMGLQVEGGWAAVDAAFASPPASTEQILHPEKYAAQEAPVAVTLPRGLAARLGAGWKQTLEDTFGEFQLSSWLRIGGATDATEAAAGWGGDRIALYEGPDGTWAVLLVTDWDSVADADVFRAAVPSLANSRVTKSADRVVVTIASDTATLDAISNAAGG